MRLSPLPLVLAAAAALPAQETLPGTEPLVEFGRIDWLRDFDTARRTAAAQDLDLLMLFQEVPG